LIFSVGNSKNCWVKSNSLFLDQLLDSNAIYEKLLIVPPIISIVSEMSFYDIAF